MQLGRARLAAHPLVGDLLELAGVLELPDRLVHAVGQLGVLAEHDAPVVAAGRGELAGDLRLGDLRRGEVERGREVDDDRVHPLRLQRADGVVGVVEHLRLARRLDQFVDGVEARRADLDAELRVRELGQRGRVRRRRRLERDDRLGRRVVRVGEVDPLRALRRDRDLVDVEVELLLARGVGGVERHHVPLDRVLGEAELLRDRVGDRALEALAVRGVVVLEVRRVGGLVGPHGQLAVVHQRELVGRAGIGGRRRRGGRLAGRRAAVVVGAAGGDADGEQGDHEQKGEAGHGGVLSGAGSARDANRRSGWTRPVAAPAPRPRAPAGRPPRRTRAAGR